MHEDYIVQVRKDGDWLLHWEDRLVEIDMKSFTAFAGGEHVKFVAVFVATRGPPGEDGTLQAYLDSLNIPYTHSGAEAARLVIGTIPVDYGGIGKLPTFSFC